MFSKLLRKSVVKYKTILKSPKGRHWHKDPSGKHVYDTTPITAAEVGKQLNDFGLWHYGTQEFCEAWEKHIPHVSPTEFFSGMFGKGHTNAPNLDAIRTLEFDKGVLTLDASNCTVHGAKAMHYKRVFLFNTDPKGVEHDLLKLDPDQQGGGVVKKLFKDLIPLYKKMGLSTIDMHAALEGGAYTWAKYGFKYYNEVAGELHQHELLMGFKSLRTNGMSPDTLQEHDAVNRLLHSANEDRLWLLADMKTPHLDRHFDTLIKKEVGVKGSFIKLLFTDTAYHGVMQLDGEASKSSLDRLQRYIHA